MPPPLKTGRTEKKDAKMKNRPTREAEAADQEIKKPKHKRKDTGHKVPPPRSLAGRIIVSLSLALIHRKLNIVVEGRENIPKDLPYVIIANHVTYIDALWIFDLLPPEHYAKTCAMIGADLQTDYGILGKLMFQAARAIPVERKGSAGARSLITAKNALEAGNNILIHPEGTRSKNGRLGPFQSGSSYLSTKYDAPVLPIYIKGGHAIWPPGQRFPSFTDPEGKKRELRLIIRPCLYGEDYPDAKAMTQDLQERFQAIQDEIGY